MKQINRGSSVHHGNILAHNRVWLCSTRHNRRCGYEQQPPLASMVNKGAQEQDASCQADACCYPPGPLHHPGGRIQQCLACNWVAGHHLNVATGCTHGQCHREHEAHDCKTISSWPVTCSVVSGPSKVAPPPPAWHAFGAPCHGMLRTLLVHCTVTAYQWECCNRKVQVHAHQA